MKRLIFLFFLTCFSMFESYSQEAIYMPKGSLIQSLRNDGKSEINIPGCEYDGLKMDDINNLYGNYWRFYLIGTVDGLADITEKPYCQSVKIALRKGCGYVACHSESSGDIYVRIYVTEMVTNKAGEIIGATLLYQTNYQSEWEIKRYEQEKAEREAAKIFWNGNSVTDVNLRKVLLEKFDSDNDGKISQTEAAKQTSLTIEGGSSMSFYESGIGNLTGLTSLTLNNTSISGSIILAMPNLQKFVLKKNQSTLSTLDLTGCVKIDSVAVGGTSIDKMTLTNCTSLRYLDFTSSRHTIINEQLDISGCKNLKKILGFEYNGKLFNLTNCTALEHLNIPFFNEINFSGCTGLIGINRIMAGYEDYKYLLKKLNLTGCHNINNITLAGSCHFSELNLNDCENLRHLLLSIPELSVLNMSKCIKLENLTITSKAIKSLDLSGFNSIKRLECFCDSIASISLNDCHNLQTLLCAGSSALTTLDVSDCDSLTYLNCNNNPSLSVLDVTKNLKLKWIQCCNTAIQELDISNSETIEWAGSVEEDIQNPITVPSATQGFKILWVNERQKIQWFDRDWKSHFSPIMDDEDFIKKYLTSPFASKQELMFKIKVKK